MSNGFLGLYRHYEEMRACIACLYYVVFGCLSLEDGKKIMVTLYCLLVHSLPVQAGLQDEFAFQTRGRNIDKWKSLFPPPPPLCSSSPNEHTE